MGWFNGKAERLKEAEQQRKITASQDALLASATNTADAAQHVTSRLKLHLEESIQQFEATVRIISDALLVSDGAGLIRAINPAAEAMFGAAADLVNTPVSDLFRLSGVTLVDCRQLWQAIEQGRDGVAAAATLVGRRGNGESFPIEIHMTQLDRSVGGRVVLIVVRDMTSFVEAVSQSRSSEYRFNSLLDVSFDGVLVVQNGDIVAANSAAERLFNKDNHTLMNAAFPALLGSVNTLTDIVGNANGNPMQGDAIHADGSPMPLVMTTAAISWNNQPACLITVKDVGKLAQLSAIGRGRCHAEADMIVCFAPDFKITFVNEPFSRYYAHSRAALIGSDLRELLSEGEHSSLLLQLRSMTRESATRRVQVYAQRGDGATRIQDWIDHVSYAEDGTPVEYQRSGRDITQRMQDLIGPRVKADGDEPSPPDR